MLGNVYLPGNVKCGCHLLGSLRNEGGTIVSMKLVGEAKSGNNFSQRNISNHGQIFSICREASTILRMYKVRKYLILLCGGM